MAEQKKGLRELYATDPERADWLLFGRRSNPITRRGFLSGLGCMSASSAMKGPAGKAI